jgi:GxxExxY protein
MDAADTKFAVISREDINRLGEQVVGALIEVHRHLGPGLLESAYEMAFCHELALRKIPFERQCAIPIRYKGINLESGLRLDVLVAEAIVIELKAVAEITPVFEAQILSHLKLASKPLGYLANFHVKQMKDGIRRFANFRD